MARSHQFAAIAGLGSQPLRVGRAMPLLNEPVTLLLERHGHRAHCLLQRGVVSLAHADGQNELPGSVSPRRTKIQFPKQRDITVRRRAELPIHGVFVHQVVPAIALAHKPATHACKSAIRPHGNRPLVLPCQQHFVPRHVDGATRIPRPATVQMRSQQRIYLQPRQQILMTFQAHPGQNHAVVRVADDLLDKRVPALRIAIDIANTQRFGMNVLKRRQQIPLLFVGKGLPVADQEFHIAHLRAVDGRVIYLVENSVRAREPHAARRRISRPYRVLHARGPAWFDSRRAKGLALLVKPAIEKLIAHAFIPIFQVGKSTFLVSICLTDVLRRPKVSIFC